VATGPHGLITLTLQSSGGAAIDDKTITLTPQTTVAVTLTAVAIPTQGGLLNCTAGTMPAKYLPRFCR
jgi:Pilin (bacterial filament)